MYAASLQVAWQALFYVLALLRCLASCAECKNPPYGAAQKSQQVWPLSLEHIP